MALCNHCQNLLSRIVLVGGESGEEGIPHHASLAALLDAATACRLCNLLQNQLDLHCLDWLRYENPHLYESFKQSAIHVEICNRGTKGIWITASLSVREDERIPKIFQDRFVCSITFDRPHGPKRSDSIKYTVDETVKCKVHLVAIMKSNGALFIPVAHTRSHENFRHAS